MCTPKTSIPLGVDSPFFSTIVLVKNRLFPGVFDGLLKRSGSPERMELEVTPRIPALVRSAADFVHARTQTLNPDRVP